MADECGAVASVGLSPLARGTLARCAIKCFRPRFIPAGAGNTNIFYIHL
ncbi:hypothetical protein CWT02_0847 [Salmonella enterica subsp. enterica serovar Cubana]|nr:hypothetical protein CWT02_0847 [Salmonella enterica subsp. enterica serovar Cubana]